MRNAMKVLYNILTTLIICQTGYGQITFKTFHGGTSFDYGAAVLALPDGYLIYGDSRSRQGIQYESYLVKTNQFGNKIWDKYIIRDSTIWDDYAVSITKTHDDHFVFVSKSVIYLGSTYEDVLLTKTDTLGNVIWEKRYQTPNWDMAKKVVCTPDSGFLIASNINNQNWIIKTNSSGDSTWSRKYFSTDNYDVRDLVITQDSNFVITGVKRGYDFNSLSTFLIKFNNNGDTIWTKILDSLYDNEPFSIDETDDGGFIIAAKKYSPVSDGYGYLIRTDVNGDTLWTHKNPINIEIYDRVLSTIDNGYLVTTSSLDLYKFDVTANIEWSKSYSAGHQEGNSLIQTSDSGFVLVGSDDGLFGLSDYVIIKTNKSGNVNSVFEPITYSGISVFPNPATNFLYIYNNGSVNINSAKILDTKGSLILNLDFHSSYVEIPIQTFNSGLYFVLLTDNKGNTFQSKFIKQ